MSSLPLVSILLRARRLTFAGGIAVLLPGRVKLVDPKVASLSCYEARPFSELFFIHP